MTNPSVSYAWTHYDTQHPSLSGLSTTQMQLESNMMPANVYLPLVHTLRTIRH